MSRKQHNVGVILAAGKGSRMGDSSTLPKQYRQLGGQEVIRYSLDRFSTCPGIDEICIVTDKDWIHDVTAKYATALYPKVRTVIPGGADRFTSCHQAIQAYQHLPHEDTNLIFHDAARPLLSAELLQSVIDALAAAEAVTPAIPCTDTILRVDTSTGHVLGAPVRSELACAQTPQGFRLGLLIRAYKEYISNTNTHDATDTCGVIINSISNIKIYYVPGQSSNIKLTHPIDFTIAESILARGEA